MIAIIIIIISSSSSIMGAGRCLAAAGCTASVCGTELSGTTVSGCQLTMERAPDSPMRFLER
jgi:hypothetical protein